jgi:N-methylhydantoinase A
MALACAAIERGIARPLGLTVDEAAAGIITLVEEQLFQAVQKISAERGHDPRRFVLVAAGGAGPMHGASIGRKLGSPAIYVPRLAGAFCALGMLNAPIKHEYSRVVLATLGHHTDSELRPAFERLERDASLQLRLDGFAGDDTELVRELELRHPGQIGTIRLPVPARGLPFADAVGEAFRVAHQRLYGHVDANAAIEIAALFVVGIGRLPRLRLSTFAPGRDTPEPAEKRAVYFGAAGTRIPTDIYRGASLAAGHELRGPAIIEETTTCVVVAPGDICRVDALGNYLIRLEGSAAN